MTLMAMLLIRASAIALFGCGGAVSVATLGDSLQCTFGGPLRGPAARALPGATPPVALVMTMRKPIMMVTLVVVMMVVVVGSPVMLMIAMMMMVVATVAFLVSSFAVWLRAHLRVLVAGGGGGLVDGASGPCCLQVRLGAALGGGGGGARVCIGVSGHRSLGRFRGRARLGGRLVSGLLAISANVQPRGPIGRFAPSVTTSDITTAAKSFVAASAYPSRCLALLLRARLNLVCIIRPGANLVVMMMMGRRRASGLVVAVAMVLLVLVGRQFEAQLARLTDAIGALALLLDAIRSNQSQPRARVHVHRLHRRILLAIGQARHSFLVINDEA